MNTSRTRPSSDALRAWLVTYLARLIGVPESEIDPAASFDVHGLDSSGAVGLSGDLEDLLGAEFETSLVYDHPSIDALVRHLVSLELVEAA